ncbi:MAG: type II secretion system protein GspG [Candidatus Berkelbacteria bacterium]|nr:type II secretion system protein GspG [Candidatus Berkelbacteria bacterium]
MEQEGNKNFQGPNKGENEGDLNNPPPAGGTPGEYQQPTPKVDNFSPPQGEGGDSSGESFKMPQSEEMKTPETPETPETPPKEPESTQIKPIAEEEPEDVFAEKEETSPPTPEPKPEPELKPQTPSTPPPSDGQKLDIPQENKGYGYLWLIIVFLIIIILVETIAVNELGIFNLGLEKYYGAIRLEKLWGGLPSEAKPALADSVKRMTGKSFKLDGSSQATIAIETQESTPSETSTTTPTTSSILSPSPSPSNVQGVETTGTENTGATNTKSNIEQIKKEGFSLQSEVKIKATFQSPDKFEVDLATDTSDIGGSVASLLGTETMIDLSMINDGRDVYLKNENLKKILGYNKDWLKIITSSQETTTVGNATKVSDLVTSGERTGSGRVNGVSCYIYEVKVSGPQFSSYLSKNSPNFAWIAKDITFQSVKFYLGKRDHLMHKLEINFANMPSVITIKNKVTLNFSDIGKQITVDVPTPDVVVEKNWSDVKNTFVSGSATPTPTPSSTSTPQDRDQQRKADLKKIQDALLQYKVQNGKYPSTNETIEKTKDLNSNLKSALVPKYLDTLPVDPENDKYYYGYKSDDGTKCEIWSVLETTTDTEGENYQGLWIYKLRGN